MPAKGAKKDGETPSKRGKAVVLPNGELRVDFIRNAYYDEGKTRSEIVKALKEMGHEVPYQIVFASTKVGEKGKPETKPQPKVKQTDEKADAK